MATIVATYDTETKKLKVTTDGKDEGDVSYFSCYSSCCGEDEEGENYGSCSIEKKPIEKNGVCYRETAYAHAKSGKEALELYFMDALRKK